MRQITPESHQRGRSRRSRHPAPAVFNTLFGLLTQARQAECFSNVARVLGPAGVFVIESYRRD